MTVSMNVERLTGSIATISNPVRGSAMQPFLFTNMFVCLLIVPVKLFTRASSYAHTSAKIADL